MSTDWFFNSETSEKGIQNRTIFILSDERVLKIEILADILIFSILI